MDRILIAGDLVCDNNIAHYPAVPSTHHKLPSKTMLRKRPGGASYLKDIIKLACCDITGLDFNSETVPLCFADSSSCRECDDTQPDKNNVFADNVYQIWSLREKEHGSKEKVWRISELLGCEKPDKVRPMILPDVLEKPYTLVLDNLGMGGFKDIKSLKALIEKRAPERIVLKVSSLMMDQPLLDYLLGHADTLTIVLHAETLRERGAAISKGLSWDRTIEETVKEFTTGLSAGDLACCERVIVQFGCEGAASFSRHRLSFKDSGNKPVDELLPHAELAHFLFHPREHEGAFKAKRPGSVYGGASIITASVIRHLLQTHDYPLFVALGRALAAVRINHELGGGKEENFDPDTAHQEISHIFHPATDAKEKPEDLFGSAFNHDLFTNKTGDTGRSNLLQDVTGTGQEYVAAKAMEIIYHGAEKALRYAPMARYGGYATADREEIERINSVRSLITQYQKNITDTRPLSIAVFGPPGSGKSFAIKQLAQELFGKDKKPLEFNLSQFDGEMKNLHEAFHVVRDASIKGQVPLVFWDEFDSDNLHWLKEFLAPMQDAEFRSGSLTHPFGKAIFVFAGGTSDTFEAFDQADETVFQMVKGPDFVSRLRGFVNVKGPNPVEKLLPGEKAGEISYEDLVKRDSTHLIRRAMLLRSVIERNRPQLIGAGKKASVGSDVVRGFLRVKKFKHGARSLESLVSMSDLADAGNFGGASLPNPDLLGLHVTDDFLGHVEKGQLGDPIIEVLAEACHKAWKKQKENDGYIFGEKRDDLSTPKKKHPLIVPYNELNNKDKEGNRLTACKTEAKLLEIGYVIKRSTTEDAAGNGIIEFSNDERASLMIIEHDIWLRDHLIKGYTWAEESNDNLRLHRDVTPNANVPAEDVELDGVIVDSIIPALKAKGYSLVKG